MKQSFNYRIFADAAIDIDAAFIKSEEIEILPVNCIVSDYATEYTGKEKEEKIVQIYDRQRKGEVTSTTSLKQQDFERRFETMLKHGIGVLYISISNQLSDAFKEAMKAKQNMEKKYGELPFMIVDSLAATGGFGIIAEKAIKNKRLGMDLESNARDISKMSGSVNSWFYVNDLDYLRRNGKTSAAKSIIGTFLGIKPILRTTYDGQLRQIDKKFGAKKACEVLKELYLTNGGSTSEHTVYITHSDDYESALKLKKMVLAATPEVNVKIRMLSPIIGSHTGSDVIVLSHYPSK